MIREFLKWRITVPLSWVALLYFVVLIPAEIQLHSLASGIRLAIWGVLIETTVYLFWRLHQ